MPDGHGNTRAEHLNENRKIPYNHGRDRSFGPANKYINIILATDEEGVT
jgi:putative salt-induced outer membrane protein YdiY